MTRSMDEATTTHDLLNGAIDQTQASLARTMKLAEKLAAQGQHEEAQAALQKSRRQAAGLFACLSPSKPRDKAYREMLEHDLAALEKTVARLKKPAANKRFTKTVLVVGAIAVLIGFAALLV